MTDGISSNAYDLIERLLDMDYKTRIGSQGIDEIKQHPFFNGIQWSKIRDKPGFIIPKNVLQIDSTKQRKDQDSAKLKRFLQGLQKKEGSEFKQDIKK